MSRAKRGETNSGQDKAAVFDDADVLIIDSDLTPDKDANPGDDPESLIATHLVSELGAEVAHLARAYTTVGAIVVVNQGAKTQTFDLTMTRDTTGVADVYVTDDEIDNPGLWDPTSRTDYRPWTWPHLAQLSDRISDAVGSLKPDTRVMAYLALDDARVADALLPRQIELISDGESASILAMTVNDVAMSSGFGLGLRPKEKATSAMLLRIGVCGTRRWLERLVLPAQNLLIDLPHLLQQHPWLVSDRSALESWNDHAGWWFPDAPPVLEQAHNTTASALLGRNVWNVLDLPPRPPGQRARPDDPVFQEDDSQFATMERSYDYLTNIEGVHDRRFIAKLSGVEYVPRNRLVT
jgi:hypothetical protein